VRDAVAAYVEGLCNERDIEHSCNLFESGLLTSLDVLSLVAFVEDTFAVEVSGDDIDIDSFGTIDGLVKLVTAKQQQTR